MCVETRVNYSMVGGYFDTCTCVITVCACVHKGGGLLLLYDCVNVTNIHLIKRMYMCVLEHRRTCCNSVREGVNTAKGAT